MNTAIMEQKTANLDKTKTEKYLNLIETIFLLLLII